MCMYDDGEPWKLYSVTMRRAAKPWRCDECYRDIERGETYRYSCGLSEYGWETFRICAHCTEAVRWLDAVCSGWMHHATKDDLWNHIGGDESYERTAPLIRLFRWEDARWRDRTGNLRPVADVAALTDRAIEASRKRGSVAA